MAAEALASFMWKVYCAEADSNPNCGIERGRARRVRARPRPIWLGYVGCGGRAVPADLRIDGDVAAMDRRSPRLPRRLRGLQSEEPPVRAVAHRPRSTEPLGSGRRRILGVGGPRTRWRRADLPARRRRDSSHRDRVWGAGSRAWNRDCSAVWRPLASRAGPRRRARRRSANSLLSANVAESSITIEGVAAVIGLGLARCIALRFAVDRKLPSLNMWTRRQGVGGAACGARGTHTAWPRHPAIPR